MQIVTPLHVTVKFVIPQDFVLGPLILSLGMELASTVMLMTHVFRTETCLKIARCY